jgi:ubiquinone/menaquinone biosynthesis C-methylase UbiE
MTKLSESPSNRAYQDGSPLNSRIALYEYARPSYNAKEEIIKGLHLNGNETILDVGCGTGALLLDLRIGHNHRGAITGLDLSETITQSAKNRSEKEGLSIKFVHADVQNMPFSDGVFDIVIASHMIYHVPNINRGLAEMARVIKPYGRLALSANSTRSRVEVRTPLKKAVAQHFHLHSFPDDTRQFNIETGGALLKQFFRDVSLNEYRSVIEIDSIDPYISYFNSLRYLWGEKFTDSQWAVMSSYAREWLMDMLRKEKILHETNIFGIFFAKNKRI